MADISFLMTDTCIDYSIKDGRVRMFKLNGKVLHDEDVSSVLGWKDLLVELVLSSGLHIDDGHGLPAFVYKMIDDGLIDTK